ncbi:ATP-grasp domain-containing protein, partial [Mycobacterium sp.]|uniref:ATP-grasp domain-containing protein n=1 Tax=Mycobacterium sp. TaxID=1785 RepID=UPI003BB1EA57
MSVPVGRGAAAAVLTTAPVVAAPIVTVLTTRPAHPTPRLLAEAGRRHGIVVRCGPRLDPRSSLVFAWNYRRPVALAAVRAYCDHHSVEHANTEQVGKWDQLVRLCDAGIPIPNSRRADRLEDARYAAALIGYPVIIKTNWGLRSQGVELVGDAAELDRAWTGRHRVVQSYLPEGARCTRLLVIGDRVVSGVTRVALDGVHATYDHGRRAILEAYPLAADRVALAVAACRAVGVEVGGVDIVETAAGPCVLEVNHARVEFSDRDLHGPDAVDALAAWLAGRAHAHENARCATDPADGAAVASVGAGAVAQAGAGTQPSAVAGRAPRLRIVTGQPRHRGVAAISAACGALGFA